MRFWHMPTPFRSLSDFVACGHAAAGFCRQHATAVALCEYWHLRGNPVFAYSTKLANRHTIPYNLTITRPAFAVCEKQGPQDRKSVKRALCTCRSAIISFNAYAPCAIQTTNEVGRRTSSTHMITHMCFEFSTRTRNTRVNHLGLSCITYTRFRHSWRG